MCPRHGYHIFIGAGDLVTKLEQARKIGKSENRQQPQANGFYHQFLQKKKTIFLHLPRHNFHRSLALDQAQELKKTLLAKLRQPVDHLERPRALQYEWCGGFRFVMGAPPVIIQEKK
jgi:hypothetical protein